MAEPKKIINTAPYVPTHESIQSSAYNFSNDSKFLENYRSDSGKLLLNKLMLDLQKESVTHPPNSSPKLALKAIRKFIDKEGASPITTIAELKKVVGKKLYSKLAFISRLREDESLFKLLLSTSSIQQKRFGELTKRLKQYGINPANIDSFEKLVGHIYARRFHGLCLAATTRGIAEGVQNKAIKFLSQYVNYSDGNSTYVIGKHFDPVFNNDTYSKCPANKKYLIPLGKESYNNLGYKILCGLHNFLRQDVKGKHPHRNFEVISHKISKDSFYTVNLPKEIKLTEGESKTFNNVFTSKVRGANYDVDVQAYFPFGEKSGTEIRYDKDTNSLTISTKQNIYNHYQLQALINITATYKHTDFNKIVTIKRVVTVINKNEAPQISLDVDANRDRVCIDAYGNDPEQDAVNFEWKQIAGPSTKLDHRSNRRICIATKPADYLKNPLQIRVKATDAPDKGNGKPKSDETLVTIGPNYVLNSANGHFTFNLPERIELKEGQSKTLKDVFLKNIRNKDYEIDFQINVPKEAKKWMAVRHNKKTNSITISSRLNKTNHKQYNAEIVFTAKYKGKVMTTKSVIAIVNDNEAPKFSVQAPRSAENNKFCMNVKNASDPEGDPINFKWEQIEGQKVKLDISKDTKRACATTETTHSLEKPMKFNITATDNPKQTGATIMASKTATQKVTVLPKYTLDLAEGGNVTIPEHIAQMLLNNDETKPNIKPFITSSHVYIFVKTPMAIDKFEKIELPNIVDRLNVKGAKGELKRRWTKFVKIPGEYKAYYTASPLGEWIKPGSYSVEGKSVKFHDYDTSSSFNIPLSGNIKVKEAHQPIEIEFSKPQLTSNSHIQIEFRFKNYELAKKRLRLDDTSFNTWVHISTKNRYGSRIPLHTHDLRQQLKTSGPKGTYVVNFPLPSEYRRTNNWVFIQVDMLDQLGNEISVKKMEYIKTKPNFFLDQIDFKIADGVMPLPWYMIHATTDKKHKDLLKYLKYCSFTTRMNPPKKLKSLRSAVGVGYGRDVEIDSKQPRAKIPIKFLDRDLHAAQSFLGAGGSMELWKDCKLPIYPKDASKGHWTIKDVLWGIELPVTRAPGYPDGSKLLQAQKKKAASNSGSTSEVVSLDHLPSHVTRNLKTLVTGGTIKGKSKTNSPAVKPAHFTVAETNVKAGQSFHIDLHMPSVKGKYELYGDPIYRNLVKYSRKPKDLRKIGGNNYLRDAIKVSITRKKGGKNHSFTLNSQSLKKLNESTYRYTFSVPDFLPKGKYKAVLVNYNIEANYTIHYSDLLYSQDFKKVVGLRMMKADRTSLPWLKIFSDKKGKIEGKAGLQEVRKENR